METPGTMAIFNAQLPAPVIETASDAAAAAARTEIEAAYVMAYKRPRNMDDVRIRLLKESDRPGFAKEAEYAKPVQGKLITGLSIRAAEAAMRLMGNIRSNVITVFEDNNQQKLRVSVTDLETNACLSGEVTVNKTVERRQVRDGYEVVGERTNSTGQKVFIVRATEDDLQNKRNGAISKELRNLILRVLPADIREEMLQRCRKTKADSAAKDPDAEKKSIIDAFAGIGVRPIDIVQYIGHPLEAVQPAELSQLRSMYQTIRDGESTWQSYVEEREAEKKDKKKDPEKDQEPKKPVSRKPTPPDATTQSDAPTPQEQLRIAFEDFGGKEAQLNTILRKEKFITEFQTYADLKPGEATMLKKTAGTLYAKVTGTQGDGEKI